MWPQLWQTTPEGHYHPVFLGFDLDLWPLPTTTIDLDLLESLYNLYGYQRNDTQSPIKKSYRKCYILKFIHIWHKRCNIFLTRPCRTYPAKNRQGKNGRKRVQHLKYLYEDTFMCVPAPLCTGIYMTWRALLYITYSALLYVTYWALLSSVTEPCMGPLLSSVCLWVGALPMLRLCGRRAAGRRRLLVAADADQRRQRLQRWRWGIHGVWVDHVDVSAARWHGLILLLLLLAALAVTGLGGGLAARQRDADVAHNETVAAELIASHAALGATWRPALAEHKERVLQGRLHSHLQIDTRWRDIVHRHTTWPRTATYRYRYTTHRHTMWHSNSAVLLFDSYAERSQAVSGLVGTHTIQQTK